MHQLVGALGRARAKAIAHVVNALDASDAEAAGYGYGYGYASGYGYGYGHGHSKKSDPEQAA